MVCRPSGQSYVADGDSTKKLGTFVCNSWCFDHVTCVILFNGLASTKYHVSVVCYGWCFGQVPFCHLHKTVGASAICMKLNVLRPNFSHLYEYD